MDCAEEIENLTGRISAKALGEELKLSLARDRRTVSELNKTPARDGSDSAWLCGVRAINPADKSHPASKPMTSGRALLLSTMESHYLCI